MIFAETKLKGAYIIDIEPIKDKRGFFARTWCKEEFLKRGLNSNLFQCNISFNKSKGTLRGMHYQDNPYQEAKLIRCVKGVIYDVILDIRPHSKTYKNWMSIILNSKDYRMLYVPEGFAHGFQTLQDNTEVFYQMSQSYKQNYAKGILWNDKTFNIAWPLHNPIISEKDNAFLPWQEGKYNVNDF